MMFNHAHAGLVCMRYFVALTLLCLSVALPVGAAFSADVGPLSISVPQGFDGPIRSDKDGGVTTGWVKRRPATDGGTLLQVSVVDVGASLDGITPAQRAEGARHYLLEFVRGIEQRRGNFEL